MNGAAELDVTWVFYCDAVTKSWRPQNDLVFIVCYEWRLHLVDFVIFIVGVADEFVDDLGQILKCVAFCGLP